MYGAELELTPIVYYRINHYDGTFTEFLIIKWLRITVLVINESRSSQTANVLLIKHGT